MVAFQEHGIDSISHHMPLHYLPFIARSRRLKSKPALRDEGFSDNHFRSLSSRSDIRRGFEKYAFLTLALTPRIVMAKLKGGFPHITLLVPISAFAGVTFDLCRYNVAMTRRIKNGNKDGFPESPTNGKYYDGLQIPVARTHTEKAQLLEHHYQKGTMIEVLVERELMLPDDTQIICYDAADFQLVQDIRDQLNVPWNPKLQAPPGNYNRDQIYVRQVEAFLSEALANPDWRGNGLDFDNV